MSLSYLWPAFVFKIKPLTSSNPVSVLLVQLLSSFCQLTLNKSADKIEDKTWTKIGLHHFSICHLVTLHLDKSWTISGLLQGQSLSTFCPKTSCPTYVQLLSKPWNGPLAYRPQPRKGLIVQRGTATACNLSNPPSKLSFKICAKLLLGLLAMVDFGKIFFFS